MAETRISPLVLSMGEPAGIGPDLILQVWHMAQNNNSIPPFAVIADPEVLSLRAQHLGLSTPIHVYDSVDELPEDITSLFSHKLPVLAVHCAQPDVLGEPSPDNANAVTDAISQGVRLCQSNKASALVTLPIHKAVLAAADFPYPGHTEFLGKLAGQQKDGRDHLPVMMLACPGLRVVPLTVHCALSDVPQRLANTPIDRVANIVNQALIRDFGINTPRLVLAALNPHAGEGGIMGTEDTELLTPCVKRLQNKGLTIAGPHPADTLFHAAARETYDVALCTYHDQALIPLKALDFFGGVNITLGLPFIRTSPDHGTALPLAGRGKAHPGSLIAALETAQSMANMRAKAKKHD